MRNILSLVLILCVSFLTFSQQKGPNARGGQPLMSKITVTGKVVEKSSNQPLEYATIIFNSVKSGKQFGGLTNGKGQFEIEIPKGFYNIRIEFISFKTITLENKDLTEDTNLGTIALQDDNETLDEVELIAEKSTVDIRLDKKIYNIGKARCARWPV